MYEYKTYRASLTSLGIYIDRNYYMVSLGEAHKIICFLHNISLFFFFIVSYKYILFLKIYVNCGLIQTTITHNYNSKYTAQSLTFKIIRLTICIS